MIYLNKEKLTEELNKTPMIAQHIDCMDLFDAINNSIAENVTEVVRCKDCKHGSIYMTEDVCGKTLIECNHPELGDNIAIHAWDWFCADGQKK